MSHFVPVDRRDRVACDECHRGRVLAMREGYAGVGRDPERHGYAGDDLEWYARLGKGFRLFSTAAEEKWIATLETHYHKSAARALDQHSANLFLRECVLRLLLPYI